MNIEITMPTELQKLLDLYGLTADKELDTISEIKRQLKHGISIDNIAEYINGFADGEQFTYKGQAVAIYIQDHSFDFDSAVADPLEHGKKLHMTKCSHVRKQVMNNRDGRYVMAQGNKNYRITGRNEEDANVHLSVCQQCLGNMGVNVCGTQIQKREIQRSFDFLEYIEKNEIILTTSSKKYDSEFKRTSNDYPKDWSKISQNYKERQSWTCEECGIDLTDHTGLLETHHINGNKHESGDDNLKALCSDCHGNQPQHHMVDKGKIQLVRTLKTQLSTTNYRPDGW